MIVSYLAEPRIHFESASDDVTEDKLFFADVNCKK